MRKIRLTSAVKMDSPYLCGDVNDEPIVDTHVAVFAVRNKLAVWVGNEEIEPPNAGPTRAELEAEEAKHGTLKRLDDEDKVVTEPGEDKVVEPPKKPYGNAPKSAWVRYAVAIDGELSEERAEDMTKADLMSKYGSRLGDED